MKNPISGLDKGIKIYIAVTALTGLALGLSDAVMANYFKEVYAVNAQQRGFIEFPRELPGVLSAVAIASLSFLGNVKSSMISLILSLISLLVLGLTTPSFGVMLVFLFVFSFGTHMYMPLGDSIGLSLAKGENVGGWLGRFNGVKTGFTMLAGVITFAGFRAGWFSFTSPITVFLVSAALFAVIAALLVPLNRIIRGKGEEGQSARVRFVVRREYLRYYVICALFGGRKQIMLVYSPWVLIELLGFRTDTMSILAVVGSLIGIFFMPMVGKWIDRFGVKRVMTAEALAFIGIYTAYGFLSAGLAANAVAVTGAALGLVYLLYIVDKMSAQFAMVRTMYMRSIAVVPEDITPSLSLGMSIDHIVAIAGSTFCGFVWFAWGPQYVFIIAGVLSLLNLLVARGIKLDPEKA